MKYSIKIKGLIPLSLLALLFIQAPSILAQTANPALSDSNTNTNPNLAQDVQIINTILVKQGNLNSSIKVSHNMIVATQFHYALSTQSDCSLTLQISNNTVTQHEESNSNNHNKTDYLKEVFNDTFTLQNISSIDVKPTVSPDNKNITYGGSYYHFNFILNHPIIPVRISHESSLPDDLINNNNNHNENSEKALSKFNILVDNHEDTLKIMDAFNHMQTICSTHFPVHAPDVNMAQNK